LGKAIDVAEMLAGLIAGKGIDDTAIKVLKARFGKQAKIAKLFEKGMAMGIKGLSPNAFKVHPEDLSIMEKFVDWVRKSGGKGNAGRLGVDAHRLAKHYFGRNWVTVSNKRLAKAFEWAIDLNRHIPKMEAAKLPRIPGVMGFAGETRKKIRIKPSIPKELEPLAKEARKYKSAERFAIELRRKLTEPYLKGQARRKQIRLKEAYSELARQIKKGQNYPDQLKDFYNLATKGVKEVKPKIKIKPLKEIVTKVRKTTYYRGMDVSPEGVISTKRIGTYFTRVPEEAKFYGKKVAEYKITPKNPLHSESLPDAAKKLGLWSKKFEELLAKNPREADNLISKKALQKGYDAIIRRDGDWVIALDSKIIKPIKPPKIEGKERGFIKTVREAKTTAQKVAEEVKGFYQPITNKQALNQARDFIKKVGWDKAKQTAFEGEFNARNNAIGLELMRKAQKAKRYDEAIEIAEKLAEKGTRGGQFIQSFSIWSRLTPEGMLRYAAKQIDKANKRWDVKLLRKILGKDAVKLEKEDAKIITSLMQKAQRAKTEEQKAQYVRLALERINEKLPWGVSDVLDTYRYNNMLSNPLTHLRNAWSNFINTFIVRPATLTAKGKPKEAIKYELGALKAFPDAIDAFKKAIKGETPLDLAKIDVKSVKTKKLPLALTWPTRGMEASDKFFSKLIESGELATGKTIEEARSAAEYWLLRQNLNPEQQGYLLQTLDRIPAALYSLRRIPGMGWFIPFIRTPFNWAKMQLEFSPAGFATIPGAKQKREQLAKAMLGSMATMLGAVAALEGRTTWKAPSDEKEKQLFYASGRKPYSVLILGKWVPMATFGPFAWALALPAAYQYYNKEARTALTDDQLDKLSKTAASLIYMWSQSTPMSGLGGFVKMFDGDIDYSFKRNVAYALGQLKYQEGLMRYIASVIDPIYRRPRTFGEQMIADIPFLTKRLPYYREPTGEPAKRNIYKYITPYGLGIPQPEYETPLKLRIKTRQESALRSELKREGKKLVEEGEMGIKISDKNLAAIATYLGVDKYLGKQPTEPIKKAKWDVGRFKAAVKVFESEDIDETTKENLIKELGQTPEDVEYYSIAKADREVRRAAVDEIINSSQDKKQLLEDLALLRREVRKKRILTNTVIDDLVDDGVLTKEEGKYLKSIKWVKDKKTGKWKLKITKKGKKLKITGTPKFKAPKPKAIKTPKIKITVPKTSPFRGLNVEQPSIKPLTISKNFVRIKPTRLEDLSRLIERGFQQPTVKVTLGR